MSLIPCDKCRQRVPEKLSQATWAWYNAASDRVAFRQRLCVTCVATNILPLDKPLDYENGLTCPACGISTQEDMDAMYCTLFIPGSGRLQLEMPLCAPCAVELRNRAMEGATKLENRSVEGPSDSPGPSTHSARESYWDALGLGNPR